MCRKGGFSVETLYKWRAKFGGAEGSDAKRLRELESENAQTARFRGYPAAVGTDNGPEFTSRAFISWAQSHSIRQILISTTSRVRAAASGASHLQNSLSAIAGMLAMALGNLPPRRLRSVAFNQDSCRMIGMAEGAGHCYASVMVKKKDFSQVAFTVFLQATGTATKPAELTAKQLAGRKGGLSGGKQRMASLTDEQRTELALKGVAGRKKAPAGEAGAVIIK